MTHIDRQTDTRAHTLGSIATYSVKMTEYKNDQQQQKNVNQENGSKTLKNKGILLKIAVYVTEKCQIIISN